MPKITLPILISFLICVVVFGFLYYQTTIKRTFTLPLDQKVAVTTNSSPTPSSSQIDHIVVIIMENKESGDIVGNSNAPYINSLIHSYSFAANYSAVTHPSLPNYLALIGGSTFDVTSDCTNCFIQSSSLLDQLDQAHKTWKAYMESMPSACFKGSLGDYAQKHDPFIYFNDIRNNANRCQNIVPFTQFKTDFQSSTSSPNFAWITPNLCHDMHNCSVKTGDDWLSQTIPTILDSPAFTTQKSLLVITWDEADGSEDNKIPTIFIGNTVKKGYVSHTSYTHYSLLKTIEENWSLPPLTTNVEQSASMQDMFTLKL